MFSRQERVMQSIGSFDSLLHSQASQRIIANNSLDSPSQRNGTTIVTQPSIIAINSVTQSYEALKPKQLIVDKQNIYNETPQ